MRVFSQSQGKIIDIPGAQESPTGEGALSENYDTIRKAMFTAALSDPKNASKYATIANMSKPTAYETAKKQEAGELKNVLNPLSNLKTRVKQGVSGYNDYVDFRSQKNLSSQSLAKLIEKNRLSDEDRKFYLKNFPSLLEVIFLPDAAQTKLDTLETYLRTRLGENTTKTMQAEEESENEWEVME